MNEQPLSTLLKTFPHTRYYPEWRLLTWHPRGVFDDALADKIIGMVGSEERVEEVPFHRYTDFSGLTHIRLKVGHVFQIAKHRRGAPVRAFRERSAAAEWLGVPLEILQPDPR